MDLVALIREVQDFPKKGVSFKDITTLLKEPVAFKYVIDRLVDEYKSKNIEAIVAMESRGFIFGAPLAFVLGVPFIPGRKPGKLPAETICAQYALEYGTDSLEMHKDALATGQRVLIVDDLLATGGTVKATIELVEKLDAKVVGVAFLIELVFLEGRKNLKGYDVLSLIRY